MQTSKTSKTSLFSPLSLKAHNGEFTGRPAKATDRVAFEGSPDINKLDAVVLRDHGGRERRLGNALDIADALEPLADALASRYNREHLKALAHRVRELGDEATEEVLISEYGVMTAVRARALLAYVAGKIGARDHHLRAELRFLVPACEPVDGRKGIPVDIRMLASPIPIAGLEGSNTRVPRGLRVTPGWKVVKRVGQRAELVAVIDTQGVVHDAGSPEAKAVIAEAKGWAERRAAAKAKTAAVRKAADRKAKAKAKAAAARKAEAEAQAALPPSARQAKGTRKGNRRKATKATAPAPTAEVLPGIKDLEAIARELGVS